MKISLDFYFQINQVLLLFEFQCSIKMDLLTSVCMRTVGVCNGLRGPPRSLSGFVLTILNLCQNTVGTNCCHLNSLFEVQVGPVSGWVSKACWGELEGVLEKTKWSALAGV